MQKIKSVSKERYEVTLSQSEAGQYYIQVDTYLGEDDGMDSTMSDPIADYSIASFAFDARIAALEGN